MALLRLSHLAKADIEDIPFHSHVVFGPAPRQRYEALIEQALRDISADPNCAGVRRRDDLRPGLRTYHLANSRRAARNNEGIVRAPRHLILFRIADLGTIDVARLLHDSMDLPHHVPDLHFAQSIRFLPVRKFLSRRWRETPKICPARGS